MAYPSVIAIDGPAGAGKSTLGALLAERLSYLYFDTGVMYRALTLAALQAGLDLDDRDAVERLAETIVIEVTPPSVADGRQYTVLIDGQDVTSALRAREVERNVSRVAGYAGVRRELIRRQQLIGRRGAVVMVGRDIGTMVMPEAELKIFLQASLDERTRRRSGESPAEVLLTNIRDDLARRDAMDQHVMQPAPDAVFLNTDGMTPDDEVRWILDYIARHQ